MICVIKQHLNGEPYRIVSQHGTINDAIRSACVLASNDPYPYECEYTIYDLGFRCDAECIGYVKHCHNNESNWCEFRAIR